MNFLSASLTERITEQVKDQLPQILLEEVSNFAPTAAATLTEFELKKILIDKMDKSESYLAAPEHRECYEGFIKSYDLDKTLFSTYDKVYLLKRSRNDKDKDEDPSAELDRGLKKRKTSKDAEPTKGPKSKESESGSSKGTKSQPKSSGKSVQSEEPEFEVVDSDMPQDHEGNLGNDDEEPKEKVASKRDCWLMTLASSADKPSKTFDELMSTPRDFSTYIMNGLKITNQTQEALLGPAFRLLKEGGDYPFDLTKPLPLVMSGNHQKVLVDYFFNNDLKYLQGGVSTMTYTTSITNTKAAQYDLPGIEDMVPNIWVPVKPAYDKQVLWGISHWREQRTTFYRLMRSDELYKFSDRTLIGLRTSLDDIIKNIRIEYLPRRRWSTLEKKRANIMIKAIDKQLKERRMMRSLEKFVGGRHYGTDLRRLQRTK
ncbi:hypothetical protein Tco_0546964 [Tanacetum coccineum]